MRGRTLVLQAVGSGILVWIAAATPIGTGSKRTHAEPTLSSATAAPRERMDPAPPALRMTTPPSSPPLAPATQVAAPRPASSPTGQAASEFIERRRPLPSSDVERSEQGAGTEAAADDADSSRQPLYSSWASETDDRAWTAELRTHIDAAFVDLGHAGRLLELSCRTTLCRARLHFESVTEAASFGAEVGDPERKRHVFLRSSAAQGIELEVFVARAGDASTAPRPSTHPAP